jgi:hypothetical protein
VEEETEYMRNHKKSSNTQIVIPTQRKIVGYPRPTEGQR